MSLFGTVSSPTAGARVLIFQQQSAVHVHAATLSPLLTHPPSLPLPVSVTYMCKAAPAAAAGSTASQSSSEKLGSAQTGKLVREAVVLWRLKGKQRTCKVFIVLVLGG